MENSSGGVYGEISALCYLGICQSAELEPNPPQDDPPVAGSLSSSSRAPFSSSLASFASHAMNALVRLHARGLVVGLLNNASHLLKCLESKLSLHNLVEQVGAGLVDVLIRAEISNVD